MNSPLSDVDPDLFDIIEKEKNRQYKVIEPTAALSSSVSNCYDWRSVLVYCCNNVS